VDVADGINRLGHVLSNEKGAAPSELRLSVNLSIRLGDVEFQ
jgi:hypothetical protein